MNQLTDNSHMDDPVDEDIFNCLNPASFSSFFLFAGAGSGKTRSLVNVLAKFKISYGDQLRLRRRRVAIITYTNAAADEITHRLEHSPIVQVSTIHSFAWDLIKYFTHDIREWLRNDLTSSIAALEEEQSRSRNLQNKTSVDRAKKILAKNTRLQSLDQIVKFTYNPQGDNLTRDALSHTEVVSIAAAFIEDQPLMQQILVAQFPILLIDESQDTKKELMEAFFSLQKKQHPHFCLGLFGDTMQRIYTDGKENLGQALPGDWKRPAKQLNHRSRKRIITLINNIRKVVDSQEQLPRSDQEQGTVRLFIAARGQDKARIEDLALERMAELTQDVLWKRDKSSVKMLILEHHMAAARMGFSGFFDPLYGVGKFSTGLIDGSLPGIHLLKNILLPLIEAYLAGDEFDVARIMRKHSSFFKKEEVIKEVDQFSAVRNCQAAFLELVKLWENKADPAIGDVLKKIYALGLFPVPDVLLPFVSRTKQEEEVMDGIVSEEEDTRSESNEAWEKALQQPFSQVKNYDDYLSEHSRFGTQQGVKGLEYQRVMVIVDDEESRGFMFNYDKLFGSKELSDTDKRNIAEGKETGIERTRRLFYVACSRAKESLAIIAYTDQPEVVKKSALDYGWFADNEIELLSLK